MANRNYSLLGLAALTSALLVGCQAGGPPAASYAAPSFDAPHMAMAQPVAPALPPPRAMAMPPARTPAPSYSYAQVTPTAPLGWVPPVASRPWRWIVVHHSDTTTGGAAAFDAMHRAKGWDELGYDFVIGNGSDTGDGQIEVGPRWTKQKIGAHAKTPDNQYNEFGIGICLVGNFEVERPTAKQMQSLERLTAYLMQTYHISPDRIVRHGDTKNTACPGRYMDVALLRTVAARMVGVKALAKNAPAIAPGSELMRSSVASN